ncbi:MAG TPA: hypothetical protein VKA32_02580 [Gammaproteobacteria bacterium]|nr:hypothetical protein [Gammaproteobacteria bacterium]
MRAFARFVMRGRLAAVLVVAGCFAFLPLFWLSAPALGLVTLRRGLAEGALIGGLSTAALAVLVSATGGPTAGALVPLAYVWLPIMVLAGVLRRTLSLSWTVLVAGALAAVAVLAFYAVLPDPAAFWAAELNAMRPLLNVGEHGQQGWSHFVSALAPVMTGIAFLQELILVMASLLLARWWQALLYNPGGFRREFHALRLPVWYAGIGAIALLMGGFAGPGPIYDVGLVLSTVFVLQALAVAHAVSARRGLSALWLVALYVLMPIMLRGLAIVGILDAFVDLRRRLAGPENGAG